MMALSRILHLLKRLRYSLVVPALTLWGWGLYLALLASPPDYQQGESVRLMYVHVPASWWALAIYGLMAFWGFVRFVARFPLGDVIVRALAPLGCVMTILSLGTGSLWGKPMWGAYWVWDGRLTSMLILLFLYMGYFLLVGAHRDREQGLRVGSILVMIGSVNLPIIKWSVAWWQTLHQGASVVRLGGPSIHGSMLLPLCVMAAAYGMTLFILFTVQFEGEVIHRRLDRLRLGHRLGLNGRGRSIHER